MADDARAHRNRRLYTYWRTLAATLGDGDQAVAMEPVMKQLVADIDLPPLLLDSRPSIDDILRRFPDLGPEIDALIPRPPPAAAADDGGDDDADDGDDADDDDETVTEASATAATTTATATSAAATTATAPSAPSATATTAMAATTAASAPADAAADAASVRRAVIYSKLLSAVFAPVGDGQISAKQYSQWLADVGHFERVFGYAPGELRSGRGGASTPSGSRGAPMPRGGPPAPPGSTDTRATGVAPELTSGDLQYALDEIERGRGLMSAPELQASLAGMEKSLVNRMALREVLKDSKLAAKLTPSIALVEQLLRDKRNLSGVALSNAKALIRRYIDDMADLLKREVDSAPTKKIDRSVPPKRVFRNLDLKRTIWNNLINWDPALGKLFVDRLYYLPTSKKTNKTRLIVVVDQSGSMVDAMVNCTILASIFGGLPKVDCHLVAFDTEVLDLSPWVSDPLEVLLRTNLGGGNDGPKAMLVAQSKVVDPRKTVMVWISDFYEFNNDKPLMQMILAVRESGVAFVPVGSVSGSGYFSVNPWFRQQFKKHGIPLMSGSLKTLIRELKTALPQ